MRSRERLVRSRGILGGISLSGGGDRAGFVVLFAVCIIIEFLNPPLQDGEDWRAIAWNIRIDFVVWWWG
ncbi:MAG: hypothetical protein RH949_25470 [Coleofasciculus sp. A1-SPW-01]|uniref:hypothetical protein n=1 Tax=Coleofasciculus TaxID=669368 RepID=UPI0012F7091C|nr:hypothetical protein [Coleofasciculus chthonoplastes]